MDITGVASVRDQDHIPTLGNGKCVLDGRLICGDTNDRGARVGAADK